MWLISCSVLLLSGLCFGSVHFNPSELRINIDEVESVQVIVETEHEHNEPDSVALYNERTYLATVDAYLSEVEIFDNGSWSGVFNVTGVFLGTTKIRLIWLRTGNLSEEFLSVQISKEKTIVDVVFAVLVIFLVIILGIIIGTAIDLTVLRGIVTRPVGPIIGFISQFMFMPLISYGLGQVIFPDIPAFQLGLFFTGISPGGGMSNFFTYLLEGNLNLSVTMTTISVLVAFGTIPFWIFTLGQHLLDQNNIKMPYLDMLGTAIGLLVLLSIGILLKRYALEFTRTLIRFLKPFLIVVVIVLSILATIANQYIFRILTWNIVLAGLALPLSGYILGWSTAKLFCRSTPDATAIAVEIGIQNTGIAIFLLASVDQPPLIPIAVSMVTPLPLGIIYLLVKIKRRLCYIENPMDDNTIENETSPMAGGAVKQ